VATMFMSNETRALEILKKYNVKYVVVFTTFYVTQDTSTGEIQIQDRPAWGEEGKWQWMVKIAGDLGNETDFGEWEQEQGTTIIWTEKGKNTVLYKLMNYGRYIRLYYESYKSQYGGEPDEVTLKMALESYKVQFNLEHFNLVYFSKGAQKNPFILVGVYEVEYS